MIRVWKPKLNVGQPLESVFEVRRSCLATSSDIVVPLIAGLGGGVIGATFARISSRNDARRDRYAAALTAFRAFRAELRAGAEVKANAAEQEARDLADWLVMDEWAVGSPYLALIEATRETRGDPSDAAIDAYLKAGRAYTRWTLYLRPILHLNAGPTKLPR
jgi:hypothetical protein